MKLMYIVGIIILMGETECFIEDTASIKILEEQKVLLRKLQNIQDPKDEKPLTWNEMLADVLLNKINLFSFHKVNENELIKQDPNSTKTTGFLTTCFSQVLLFYKNCIYDRWTKNVEEPEFGFDETTTKDDGGIIVNTDLSGPKGEVEIIEPQYHGKQVDVEEGESITKCPEGSVKDEKGDCVNEHSRLLISVPSQCPVGYRADRLGNCRPVFF